MPIAGVTTYRWYNQAGNLSVFGLRVGLSNLTSDSLLYLEVVQNGCTYLVDSGVVQVRPVPNPPVLTGTTLLCEGDALQLNTSTIALNYSWTAPSGAITTAQRLSIPAVTVADSGYYWLTAQTINGCSLPADSIFVQVQARPAAPTVGSPTTVCGTDSLLLEVALGSCDSVVWTAPNGSQWIGRRLAFASNSPAYLAGNWQVVCIDLVTGCISPSTIVTISFSNIAAPTITNTTTVCQGENKVLTATGGVTYTWYRDPTLTNIAGVGASLTVNNLQADSTYYLVNTAANGCRSLPVAVTVTVYPTAGSLNLGPDQLLCEGDDLLLTTTTGFVSYSWSGPAWLGSTQRRNIITTTTLANTGAYSVAVRDGNNCLLKDTINVTVQALPNPPSIDSIQLLCLTDTLVLQPRISGITCDSMYWTGPNGIVLSGRVVTILPGSNNFVSGSWYLHCLDTSSNCASRSNEQVVIFLPPPIVPTTTSSSPVCSGGAVQLSTTTSTPFTRFYWYASLALDSVIAIGQNPTMNNITSDTIFYLVVDNGAGCLTAPIATPVTLAPPTAAPVIISNAPYCIGAPLLLTTNNNAATYYWTCLIILVRPVQRLWSARLPRHC